jgi:hypothetical protein
MVRRVLTGFNELQVRWRVVEGIVILVVDVHPGRDRAKVVDINLTMERLR